MAQSIQRGDGWWNQRPDGVWLKWSNQNQAWEPQEGSPPPPGTPDNPFSTAGEGEFPPVEWNRSDSGGSNVPKAGVPATESKKETKRSPSIARQAVIESLTDQSPALRANGPLVSETGRRGLPPIRENRVLLAIVAGLLIVGVFAGAYFGAVMVFGDGSSVANAQESVKTPKGYTTDKWTYILKMDAFCREANLTKYMQDLAGQAEEIESEEEFASVLEEIKGKFNEVVSEFREGPLPKQDRRLLNRIHDLHASFGSFFDVMGTAVEARDVATIQEITAEAASKAMLEVKLMSRYGFQVCGKGSI